MEKELHENIYQSRRPILSVRGGYPDDGVSQNDASRALIEAVAGEYGQAWLARCNLYHGWTNRQNVTDPAFEPINWDVPIWQWSGKKVYNFGADAVLLAYDAELERIVHERNEPSDGYDPAKNSRTVNAFFDRVKEIGGFELYWS